VQSGSEETVCILLSSTADGRGGGTILQDMPREAEVGGPAPSGNGASLAQAEHKLVNYGIPGQSPAA
jgi:hypothetical protein